MAYAKDIIVVELDINNEKSLNDYKNLLLTTYKGRQHNCIDTYFHTKYGVFGGISKRRPTQNELKKGEYFDFYDETLEGWVDNIINTFKSGIMFNLSLHDDNLNLTSDNHIHIYTAIKGKNQMLTYYKNLQQDFIKTKQGV